MIENMAQQSHSLNAQRPTQSATTAFAVPPHQPRFLISIAGLVDRGSVQPRLDYTASWQ